MASRRRLILEGFRDRVALITIAGGFLTDAGEVVFLGEDINLGPDDPEAAIALVIEEDAADIQTPFGPGNDATIQINLVIGVQAIVKADLDAPLIAIENVISDIKKAVELNDRTLGGLIGGIVRRPTRALDREEGSTIAGASIDYEIVYAEAWGDPDE